MRRQLWWSLVGLLCFFGAGCSSTPEPVIEAQAEEPPPPPPPPIRDQIDLSLAALLDQPRPELARMADEVMAKIRRQEQAYLEGKHDYALLPELRFSIHVPVFQEAKFSPRAGFSLPPYVTEPTHDPAVAMHLARYGDVEAASKLAGDEPAQRERLDACRYGRNYPVEWTRLVGLLLHAAQVRLATGDLDGATELIALHQQLRQVLDPKAATGPLGAELLARGRHTLRQAADTWKKENQAEFAGLGEKYLAAWGDVPRAITGVEPGSDRARVLTLFGGTGQGRVIVAQPPQRTLDLLALPVPRESVEAVLACLDARDQLTEVLVIYRARVNERFPDPARLGLLMEDQDPAPEETSKAGWWTERRYALAGVRGEVMMVIRGVAVGAVVRFRDPDKPGVTPSLARDFGAVHLDRSFEQNRVQLAPEMAGNTLQIEQGKLLARITNPAGYFQPIRALLYKAGESRVTGQLTLQYSVQKEVPPLFKVALPLWAIGGACRFEPVVETERDYLACIWEDAQTRYTLRLPAGDAPLADLALEDRRGLRDLGDRTTEVTTFDRTERKARFQAHTQVQRIRRGVPELDAVQLGMSKDEVKEALAEREDVLRRAIPGGLALTFAGDPAGKVNYVLRQLFVRYDKEGRVAELRVRYHDTAGSPAPGVWTRELIQFWRKRCGAPEKLPAPWATIWADQPTRAPTPALYRWLDDVTLVTCQVDGAGAEVVLRDCPEEMEFGANLGPLDYLPRGPSGCLLGTERGELVRKWGMGNSASGTDGSMVLKLKAAGPYDSIKVWFDANDRVARIIARHTPKEGEDGKVRQLADELEELWGDRLKTLGWARRQDVSAQKLIQALGWEDDRTRLRIYWEKPGKETTRLFTEWKALD